MILDSYTAYVINMFFIHTTIINLETNNLTVRFLGCFFQTLTPQIYSVVSQTFTYKLIISNVNNLSDKLNTYFMK